jgi:hypothetical protein
MEPLILQGENHFCAVYREIATVEQKLALPAQSAAQFRLSEQLGSYFLLELKVGEAPEL